MIARFADLGTVPPEYGAAADAVVFDEVSERRSPSTLHIYSRDRTTISLGRFRDLDTDVRKDVLEHLGLSVIRRISGGSTILTGTSQIIYSLTSEDIFLNKKDSYVKICGCIVSALNSLGLNAEYKEPNDVLVRGMKISGGAQYRAIGCLIQHGTVIVEPEPLIDEVLVSTKDRKYLRTTSISECLGHSILRENIVNALRTAFENNLSLEFTNSMLTDRELKLISQRSESFKV